MDLKELVDQIAAKVAEKISDMENGTSIDLPNNELINKKSKLLILSESHGTACHELWENVTINQKFDIVCALNNEYVCDIEQVDIVVLRNLSNKSLGKITEGIGDSPFAELVIKAILLGKKIIIPCEEIEIFQYKESAPKRYYNMMMQKVEFLKGSGITLCNIKQIEDILLESEEKIDNKDCIKTSEEKIPDDTENDRKLITFEKRVITERDIHFVCDQHLSLIGISPKTIVTDLAREYAEQKGISFTIG